MTHEAWGYISGASTSDIVVISYQLLLDFKVENNTLYRVTMCSNIVLKYGPYVIKYANWSRSRVLSYIGIAQTGMLACL